MGKRDKWYVYENLNDSSDRIVVKGGKVVAAVYKKVAGPFSSKKEAETVTR